MHHLLDETLDCTTSQSITPVSEVVQSEVRYTESAGGTYTRRQRTASVLPDHGPTSYTTFMYGS